MPLKDYKIQPLSGAAPRQAVIFLHGLGDNGSGGLLTIGKIWGRALPDCLFLCPDAPEPYDMAPPGFGGRQWFSLREFTLPRMIAGTQSAAPILNAYIDSVMVDYNLPASAIALVGFSQGSMMALYTAPRRNEPLAAVIGFSGGLIGAETLAFETKSRPPILLGHGLMDTVVPAASLPFAETFLKNNGFTVETITRPMLGHSIDDAEIAAGQQFLTRYMS